MTGRPAIKPELSKVGGGEIAWRRSAEGNAGAAQATEALSGREAALRRLVEGERESVELSVDSQFGKIADGNKAQGSDDILDQKRLQLIENRATGKQFEEAQGRKIENEQREVRPQNTIKTGSGVKTRIDLIGMDSEFDKIRLTELKSSETAPLTRNQRLAFPEIEKSGATVIGKGKHPYISGYSIPPTTIEIIRP